LFPYILFEIYLYILALGTASPGNQHCAVRANGIGTLSFLVRLRILSLMFKLTRTYPTVAGT